MEIAVAVADDAAAGAAGVALLAIGMARAIGTLLLPDDGGDGLLLLFRRRRNNLVMVDCLNNLCLLLTRIYGLWVNPPDRWQLMMKENSECRSLLL